MIQRQSDPIQAAAAAPRSGMLAPVADSAEMNFDAALRPRQLAEYAGQTELKKQLGVSLAAARGRGETLEHCLLAGSPGLGKTTLAHLIAAEMGGALRISSGPAIGHAGDLAAILSGLQPGDILFIDEIHRLRTVVEETLYTAMEDFALDIILGKGPTAKTMRLDLPRFTLIGATTRPADLSGPLRDRFGHQLKLAFYSPAELEIILARSACELKIAIEPAAAARLAACSRGTPRIANRLLRRARDFAQVAGLDSISLAIAERCLAQLGIDERGLDAADRAVLSALSVTFGGQPVGLSTLAAATGEPEETIETVIEPYLIQLGLLARTPRGRVAVGFGQFS